MNKYKARHRIHFFPFLFVLLSAHTAGAAEGPWRLNEALGIGDGFSISVIQRTRFENIHDNVRPGTSPNDQGLILRTHLDFKYQREGFGVQMEFVDARQELADDDSVINTITVNALEVLQANFIYNYGEDDGSFVRIGRLSTDWGSRRFLARNRFRNTINAFDGVELHHELGNGNYFQLLASQVVRVLPSDRIGLLDNERITDKSSDAQQFYALQYSTPNLIEGVTTDLFYFALREHDRARVNTRNRKLNSLGVRLRAAPAPDEFDFEFESLFQFGDSHRSTAAADTTELDHNAWFLYAAAGYSFPGAANLRAVVEFDYASGDKDPDDLDNERFDSLFGVSTFEFGPLGLYDPFSRTNLVSPGIRLFAEPWDNLDLMASYRHFWLAEKRDSWGRTGLRDTTGGTDSYLGQHLELRLRWDVLPGNLRIETGAIFLDAENLSDKNTRYGYLATVLTF